MAINFCTLTNSTIDTFCGNRRQLILDRLLEERYPPAPPPVLGTNNSSVREALVRQRPELFRRPAEEEELTQLTFEQPFITVTAELLGTTGTHQLDAATRLDFVVVTNLRIGERHQLEATVAVNISDFKVL
jgi:hypothetical protein